MINKVSISDFTPYYPPGPAPLLQDNCLLPVLQKPEGSRQAGDAAADDGNQWFM